jgi:hypothetical protein
MIVRTICDMMTSADPSVRKLVRQFKKEQGEHFGLTITETTDEKKGFSRWAKMHSFFWRAFKACQITDISVRVETDGCIQLTHHPAS